jgi:hypothetical protein
MGHPVSVDRWWRFPPFVPFAAFCGSHNLTPRSPRERSLHLSRSSFRFSSPPRRLGSSTARLLDCSASRLLASSTARLLAFSTARLFRLPLSFILASPLLCGNSIPTVIARGAGLELPRRKKTKFSRIRGMGGFESAPTAPTESQTRGVRMLLRNDLACLPLHLKPAPAGLSAVGE